MSDRTVTSTRVGQVEAPLGLDHVGEQREHRPVLLDQGQLDLRLVPLEILFAHRRGTRLSRMPGARESDQERAVRRSLILAALPCRSRR